MRQVLRSSAVTVKCIVTFTIKVNALKTKCTTVYMHLVLRGYTHRKKMAAYKTIINIYMRKVGRKKHVMRKRSDGKFQQHKNVWYTVSENRHRIFFISPSVF